MVYGLLGQVCNEKLAKIFPFTSVCYDINIQMNTARIYIDYIP